MRIINEPWTTRITPTEGNAFWPILRLKCDPQRKRPWRNVRQVSTSGARYFEFVSTRHALRRKSPAWHNIYHSRSVL